MSNCYFARSKGYNLFKKCSLLFQKCPNILTLIQGPPPSQYFNPHTGTPPPLPNPLPLPSFPSSLFLFFPLQSIACSYSQLKHTRLNLKLQYNARTSTKHCQFVGKSDRACGVQTYKIYHPERLLPAKQGESDRACGVQTYKIYHPERLLPAKQGETVIIHSRPLRLISSFFLGTTHLPTLHALPCPPQHSNL